MILKKYWSHYRLNLKIALPITISQMGQALTGIVDNAMIGHVDTVSLAAAAFSLSVFIIVMIFGMGFSFGLTPLTGATYGEQDHKAKAGELFRHSLLLNIILTTFLTIALVGGAYLMPNMGQEPDVVEKAIPYYHLLTASLFPIMIFFTFKQWAEGLESVKPAMFFTLLANVINVILNYILIYGYFGFEAMGLVGAGWATLIARIIMAVGFGLFIFYSKRFKSYIPHVLNFEFKKKLLRKITKLSFPIGLQFIVEVSAFAAGAIMIGWIGKTQLAAHQIAINLASLTFLMASGLSSAAMIRVSTQLGLKNFDAMRTIAHSCLHLAFIFMSICGVIFLIGNTFLPELHTEDAEVIKVAAGFMLVAAVFQLFDGVQVVAIGALRGISDVNKPALIAFAAHWLISLPTGYYLSQVLKIGAYGVWIGFLSGLLTASILFIIRFEKVTKKMLLQQISKPKN